MNRICSRCVGDDSLGIKCIECTVISINPLYKVTKISLLLGTLTCLGCVPVVILMWAWILNYFNILFVNALIPVIIGWLVAAMIRTPSLESMPSISASNWLTTSLLDA